MKVNNLNDDALVFALFLLTMVPNYKSTSCAVNME